MAQVSEQDLRDAFDWITQSADRIRGIQRTLDTAGADLSVDWQGRSQQAFSQVHLLWHQRIDVILGSLQGLAESIQANNANYAAFNEDAVQEINQIEALISQGPPQFGQGPPR
ncbi:WXG100 family type VII secretion target [Streptosporangium soli]|nr:WXG100 family type VII secretion target [Streptosporangium sp. KLBMP 9127]